MSRTNTTGSIRRPMLGMPSMAAGPVGQVEVDVTPVMNLFMILIPFLVSMAFFSHLAVQSFRLPASESAGQAQSAEDLPWTVAITAGRVALTRGESIVGEAGRDAGTGAYDYAAVVGLLAGARAALPELDRVVVAVDDGVVAGQIVRVLDCCREAGFAQIGLAAGTGLDGQATGTVAGISLASPAKEVRP